MARFNILGRRKVKMEDYIDPDATTKMVQQKQAEQLVKSLPKGKGQTGTAVSGLDGGSNSLRNYNEGTILQRKRALHEFSKNIIVQSIIRTRNSQLRKYTRPARESSDGVGFEIVPRPTGKESDEVLSPQKKHEIIRLENFIKYTGSDPSQRASHTFSTFVSQFLYNHYVFDQINVEKVRDRSHHLHHFNILDGGTIVYDKIPQGVDDKRSYKQYIAPGKDPIKFSEDELTFVIYNDFQDSTREGYGYSEVEAALSHLGYHIDTEQFNARFFSQGGTTRGLLVVDSGGTTQENMAALQSLRRTWQTSASGLNGAWKIPVISAHDAKFVNMTQNSKDMEFESWLNYLINIISSIFQIQPDEINFPNRGGATSKGGSAINEGNSQKNRMQQSKDKGLQPLLNHLEDFINDYIMPELNKDYYFRFTLGDTQSETERQQLIKQKLDNGMTLNEARKENGLPPLEDDIGNFPGNPATVVQFLQYEASQNEVFQQIQQHKNDNDPQKADHGKPEDGMPVTAIDGKTKRPTQDKSDVEDESKLNDGNSE